MSGPHKDARDLFHRAGLSAIPLKRNAKKPVARNWTAGSSGEQWEIAGVAANIGVRTGYGDLLVFDADDDATAEYALRYFEGLGIYPPGAVTRRGLHIYLKTDLPPTFTSARLAPKDWKGEALGNRSLAVAPPSQVDGYRYRPFGDLLTTPVVAWKDLLWLLPEHPREEHPPVTVIGQLLRGSLPEDTLELAAGIRLAREGEPVVGRGRVYPTRSEALGALWLRTLDAGLRPREAAALLGPVPGRSEKELEADALRVYRKLLASRSGFAGIRKDAETFAYPGRADSVRNQAKTLAAAARIAEQKGGGYLLHSKEIARVAKLPPRTATNSLGKLVDAGYLTRGKRGRWRGYYLKERKK